MAKGTELGTYYVSIGVGADKISEAFKEALGKTPAAGEAAGKHTGFTFGSALSVAAGNLIATGATKILSAAGATISAGFNRAVTIEGAQKKLEGLGHSAADVTSIMGSALDAVRGTAYGLGDAATVAALMSAAGVKSGTAMTSVLKTVADTAAISGKSFTDTGAIFTSVMARGKLQGDDMLQLMSAGVPVLKFLSDQLGVTQADVSKMVSAGKIDFATFQAAMDAGMGGAALRTGETFRGALDNVNAAVSRLGASVMTPALPLLEKIMQAAIPAIDSVTSSLAPLAAQMGERLAPYVDRVVVALGGLSNGFQALMSGGGAKGFFDTLRESSPAVASIGVSLAAIIPSLVTFLALWKAWTTIQASTAAIRAAGGIGMMASSFLSMAGPAKIIVAVIAAIVVALVAIQKETGAFTPLLDTLKDTFTSLAQAVGPVLATIGDTISGLFQRIGPALAGIGDSIAPVLAKIADSLGSVFTTIGPVISSALDAVLPVIQPLLDGISEAVSILGPAFSDAFSSIGASAGGVGAALAPVGDAFRDMMTQLGPMVATIGPMLGQLFTTLATTAAQLAPILGQVFGTILTSGMGLLSQLVTGILPVLLQAISSLLPAILQVVTSVLPVISSILPVIVNLLATLIGAVLPVIAQVIAALLPVITQIITVVMNIVATLLTALMPVITTLMTTIIPAIMSVITALLPVIMSIIDAVMPIIVMIVSTLVPVIQALFDFLTPIIDAIVQVITVAINVVAGIIKTVMQLISGDWSGAWETIKSTVGAIWDGISSAATAIWDGIVSFFQGIPDRIMAGLSFLSSLAGKLGEWFLSAVNAGKDKFNELVTWVTGIPGRVVSALGDLGSKLFDSGKQLIQGFIDGIKNMINSVTSAVTGIMDKVRSFFPFSPAKEGPFSGRGYTTYSGRALAEGFASGITDETGTVVASASRMLTATKSALTGDAVAMAPVIAGVRPSRSASTESSDLVALVQQLLLLLMGGVRVSDPEGARLLGRVEGAVRGQRLDARQGAVLGVI